MSNYPARPRQEVFHAAMLKIVAAIIANYLLLRVTLHTYISKLILPRHVLQSILADKRFLSILYNLTQDKTVHLCGPLLIYRPFYSDETLAVCPEDNQL